MGCHTTPLGIGQQRQQQLMRLRRRCSLRMAAGILLTVMGLVAARHVGMAFSAAGRLMDRAAAPRCGPRFSQRPIAGQYRTAPQPHWHHRRFSSPSPPSAAGDSEEAPKSDTAAGKSSGGSSGTLSLAVGIALWYIINVFFSLFSKQALGVFPHAWTVSVIQLATVVGCSTIGWLTGTIPSPLASTGPAFMRWLLPAAFAHALGNGLTAVALSWGSVSFMHVVKTSEPIWMALGIFLVNGTRLPRKQFLAVLPIVFGVALASAGEISFTWIGFLAAIGSTVAFAARGIFTKGLMSVEGPDGQKVSPLNAFALDSLLALAFTLPLAVAVDGGSLAADVAAAGPASRLAGLLLATGLTYYAYNAIAFQLLGLLDVVSWAVVNLGKRIVVIGWATVALNTPLTGRAVLGSLAAIAGSGLYSYVKAKA
eukprot:TRINITY_DN113276_c0_g1_i1.p1 TRINITY_DN113276_c0_g1~~TRINITY_DN113276_c0_g1_i1.p1  ORF type:complete len:424 (+),score=69.47 TRINITY_DN113276_c0_g1_i1:101-1372(+)